jgi:Holliday junction resolvase RusA-like endonuclease
VNLSTTTPTDCIGITQEPHITFFVPGVPAPGGSKKAFVVKTHAGKFRAVVTDDAKRNAPWRAVVAHVGRQAYAGVPLAEPLDVLMEFVMPRPLGHHIAGKRDRPLKATAPTYHTSKPDALKLARSTEDALTGVLWIDDATTARLTSVKRYGDKPGVMITVRRMA